MVSATVNSAPTTFGYNGDGLRDSRTFNSSTTTFTWDANRSIPQVMDDGDAQYTYGLGRIAKLEAPSVEGSGTYNYVVDGLGSTVKLIDGNTVHHDTEYDVFGAVRSEATTPITNEFKFTGEQADASTGLEYLRARYYDPATGRFISKDPIGGRVGDPRSQNRYLYAWNNPCSNVDPSGLETESVTEILCSASFSIYGLGKYGPSGIIPDEDLLFSVDVAVSFAWNGEAWRPTTILGPAVDPNENHNWSGGGYVEIAGDNFYVLNAYAERDWPFLLNLPPMTELGVTIRFTVDAKGTPQWNVSYDASGSLGFVLDLQSPNVAAGCERLP